MRKIALWFCGLNLALGLSLGEIEPLIGIDLQKVMKIVNTDKSIEQKSDELFQIFDVYFDYKIMSKLALASHYKNLTQEQQDEFTQIFKKRLKRAFSEKLAVYTNQKVTIKSSENPSPTRYFVNAEITDSNGKAYKITFKFYKAQDGNFFVYDVDIIGVSLIQTYRAQFEDLGSKVSFDEILRRLNSSNSLDK